MDKRYIDMDAYPRRAHFEYFSSMANPYMGVTVELDITDFCSRIKELGRPFFLSLLWCVNRAADSVPEKAEVEAVQKDGRLGVLAVHVEEVEA